MDDSLREAEIEAAGIELARLWGDAKGAQGEVVRQALAKVETKPRRRKPVGAVVYWQASSSWLLSGAINLAMLVGLYAFGLAVAEKPDYLLLTTTIDRHEDVQLEEMPFEHRSGPFELEQSQSLPIPLEHFDLDEFGASPRTQVPDPGAGLGLPFGQHGDGLATSGAGRGGATFFGLKAHGNRFAFVVDGSASMHKRWEACRQELIATVGRLQEHQTFYVVLFNSKAHPMFSDEAYQPAPLPATQKNIGRLRQWLAAFELLSGSEPLDAMRWVLPMRPDAIYLLTDGMLHGDTEKFLSQNNKRQDEFNNPVAASPVHTIGFYAPKGQEVLQRIAEENGGEFRSVDEAEKSANEAAEGREGGR